MAANNMISVDTLKINDISYIIFDTLELNNNTYLYLIEENDETNFCIFKTIYENNQELIVNLDDQEEFIKVFKEFAKRQKTA